MSHSDGCSWARDNLFCSQGQGQRHRWCWEIPQQNSWPQRPTAEHGHSQLLTFIWISVSSTAVLIFQPHLLFLCLWWKTQRNDRSTYRIDQEMWQLMLGCDKANSAFYPSGIGKWVPALAGKAKAGMVHSVSGWTLGVQEKPWDPLRTRAISERPRGVFTTRHYTNPRLPYLTLLEVACGNDGLLFNFLLVSLPHLTVICDVWPNIAKFLHLLWTSINQTTF